MKQVEFNLAYIPSPKGRPRITKKGFAFTPAKTRKAEADLKVLIQDKLQEGFEPFLGPVRLVLIVFLPRPKSHFRSGKNAHLLKDGMTKWHWKRPDLDNLEKLFMDAAQGILYKDDAQISEKSSMKMYADKGAPGYFVRIEELDSK